MAAARPTCPVSWLPLAETVGIRGKAEPQEEPATKTAAPPLAEVEEHLGSAAVAGLAPAAAVAVAVPDILPVPPAAGEGEGTISVLPVAGMAAAAAAAAATA